MTQFPMTHPIDLLPAPIWASQESPGYAEKGHLPKPMEDRSCFFEMPGGYFKTPPKHWQTSSQNAIYGAIVADGVTSNTGGAIASEIAVTTIGDFLGKQTIAPTDQASVQRAVKEAIVRASEEIRERARRDNDLSGMSTTLVVAVIAGGSLLVAHLGDSRAYLFRANRLYRLTRDHTWIQDALDQNKITEQEAKTHANRSVIHNSLGVKPHVNIDFDLIDPDGATTPHTFLPLKPGDAILLCSDGLTEKFTHQEVEAFILNHWRRGPKHTVNQLVQHALRHKERDNITALMLILPGGNSFRTGFNLTALSSLLLDLPVSRISLLILLGALVVLVFVFSPLRGVLDLAASPTQPAQSLTSPAKLVATKADPTATASLTLTSTRLPTATPPSTPLGSQVGITPTATITTPTATPTLTITPRPTAINTPTPTPVPPLPTKTPLPTEPAPTELTPTETPIPVPPTQTPEKNQNNNNGNHKEDPMRENSPGT